MPRLRTTAQPVAIADPEARFRHLAPQLMGYPNVSAATVETILDSLTAMGAGQSLATTEWYLAPAARPAAPPPGF